MSDSNTETETETETGFPDQQPECEFDADDLDIRGFDRTLYGLEEWECSRPVWEEASGNRCVWHAASDGPQIEDQQFSGKPPAELEETVGDGDLHGSAATGGDLSEIDFPVETGFIDAELSGARLINADLSEAILDDADLSEADLGIANLSGARLLDADLSEAILDDADLSEATLMDADLSGANLRVASLDRVGIYNTTLEGVNIDEGTTANPPSLWELKADEAAQSGLLARGGFHWLQFLRRSESNSEDLQKAEQQYRRLERLYREADLSRDTDLEIQEKHARRKRALAGGEWRQWLRKAFSRWILGYGLRIRPVLGVMIVIILLWTLLYPIPGFASQSLEATNEAATNEAEIITYETVPPELSMETVRTLRRSLYFSTITFSTLGYADVAPIRWARELATIESFLGALLMAYLVSVLSRRAVR